MRSFYMPLSLFFFPFVLFSFVCFFVNSKSKLSHVTAHVCNSARYLYFLSAINCVMFTFVVTGPVIFLTSNTGSQLTTVN